MRVTIPRAPIRTRVNEGQHRLARPRSTLTSTASVHYCFPMRVRLRATVYPTLVRVNHISHARARQPYIPRSCASHSTLHTRFARHTHRPTYPSPDIPMRVRLPPRPAGCHKRHARARPDMGLGYRKLVACGPSIIWQSSVADDGALAPSGDPSTSHLR